MTQNKTILIVDDISENRKLLAKIIKNHTDYKIIISDSAVNALTIFDNKNDNLPDLILLDIMMPEMNGFEFAKILKANPLYKNIPIIFITALSDIDDKVNAFKLGGADYITKPFEPEEVITRVNTQLKMQSLINNLEDKVKERTSELEQLNLALVNALNNANYYNDDETGNHIRRVSILSGLLAQNLGLNKKLVSEIEIYASLHDIGKVGIPDNILKKPGKLTKQEFNYMKRHPYIGYKMINYKPISNIAKNIVLYHHEKFDGSGYPQRLKKYDIPVEARIVALVDVYDALRSKRVYKPAFSIEKTNDIIQSSSGSHFDPEIVDVYFKLQNEFDNIYSKYKDKH